MQMFRKSLLLLVMMVFVACSSDKAKIEKYLEGNFSDREIAISGDISLDSAFCPQNELDNAALELMGYRTQLLMLLDQNPDSAYSLAKALQLRFADGKAFTNLAYPTGKNNRLAYMAKCTQDGKERLIAFFKHPTEDRIELSSLDIDDSIDSLMVGYNQLLNGIKVILDDRGFGTKDDRGATPKDNRGATPKDERE